MRLVILSITFSFVFMFGFSPLLAAKEKSHESIEQIEVLGQRPTSFYRKQFRLRENDFYKLYNQLIAERELQMHCERRAEPFSRIKKRVCEPRFVSLIQGEAMQRAISSTSTPNGEEHQALKALYLVDRQAIMQSTQEKSDEMVAKMLLLINSNDELREKYWQLVNAKERYEASKD